MKLLYLSQRIPFPPDRGDRIPVYNQLKWLRKKHEVVVGSLAHSGTNANAENLANELRVKVLAPDHSRWQQLTGMLSAFLRRKPLSSGYFWNPVLQKMINAELAEDRFDAVIVFSSSMAQYVECCRRMPRIMNFCDVDSQKWESLAQKSHAPTRWIYSRESRKLLAYERKIAAEFAASCVVSKNESELFRKYIPGIPVHILENGVDVDYFSAIPHKPDGLNIVLTGVMDYPPNVESVLFFVNNIWGKIQKIYPQARFVIVGANPTKRVRALAKIRGVEVTGYVPDIRPYLASATVSIAPLAVARGVQNKILEAMAAGVAVLTTPDVAKGLPDGTESLVFTAERDTESFAIALLELIRNESVREERASKAWEFVRKKITWPAKLTALDQLLVQSIRI